MVKGTKLYVAFQKTYGIPVILLLTSHFPLSSAN